MIRTRWTCAVALCVGLPAASASAEGGKVRLFILSGQSNMARLDPEVSFTPAVKKAYPGDEVIVVRHAQGGQPIRRWYKEWKAPEGVNVKRPAAAKPGDLYDELMTRVNKAVAGKTVTSVAFVWMQGEADAKQNMASVYGASLRGLIAQLRADLKRPDVAAVIGRLSDYHNGQAGWDLVRAEQKKVAEQDALAAWVDTDDLNDEGNALHYNKKGYEDLGRRFAAKAVELLSRPKPKPQP